MGLAEIKSVNGEYANSLPARLVYSTLKIEYL